MSTENLTPINITIVLLLAAIGTLLIGRIIKFFRDRSSASSFDWSTLLLGLLLSLILSLFIPGGILLFGVFIFAARK